MKFNGYRKSVDFFISYQILRLWELYKNGNYLRHHVDRVQTHAVSAILQLDQVGMNNEWPLEIYDHERKLHRMVTRPGDMILYESASAIHGRPSIIDASREGYFANAFLQMVFCNWESRFNLFWSTWQIPSGLRLHTPLPEHGASTIMPSNSNSVFTGLSSLNCSLSAEKPRNWRRLL